MTNPHDPYLVKKAVAGRLPFLGWEKTIFAPPEEDTTGALHFHIRQTKNHIRQLDAPLTTNAM